MRSPSDGAPLPEMIGPYRIAAVLGEGGMGVVYRAEQTEPVKRTVALKLIRGGSDFADVAARFEAERQALAVLEHPAIADVLGAGETDDGNPYFVMEYVDGVPISAYCVENRLNVEDKLRLFAEVCDAIQHAHQKGIIHRDLKPTNVLVTEQAGSPRPKVIDFGIAKAAGVKLSEKTLATEHGAMMGTPAYMSPEQAEGTGLDIDTRTDVYALGIMLYELLVGRVPVDPEELGFVRFLGQLLSQDTTPPTPGEVDSSVAGDLDWITMKAIEKDRERRYESPAELAADVRRFLADEPVSARPPSTSYRLQKFVRRNRAGVIAGLGAAIVLVVAAIASVTGFVRAVRAESLAVSETERATEEATTAGAVADFLVGLFESANPSAAGRPDVTARDVLEQGVATIEEELAGQPAVQARLLTAMADAYEGMGDAFQAESLFRRVLPISESARGPAHPDVAAALENMVRNVESARFAASHPFETDPEYREQVLEWSRRAVEIRGANLESDTTAWIGALTQAAHMLTAAGRMPEAEAMLTTELLRWSDELGPDHEYVIRFHDQLGRIYMNSGAARDAAANFEIVLAAEEAKESPDIGIVLNLTNNIAFAYDYLGEMDRAIPMFEQMLEVAKVGSNTAWDHQGQSFNLAIVLNAAGRYEEAAPVWLELADGSREVWGDEHPYPLSWYISGAENLVAAGDVDRGLEVLLPALESLRRGYESGAAGPEMLRAFAIGYYTHAAARIARGEDPREGLRELAGPTPELRSTAMTSLGLIYGRDVRDPNLGHVPEWILGYELRLEDALAAYRDALDATKEERWDDRGEGHTRLRTVLFDHAITLQRLGRGADLERFATEWLATMRDFEGGEGDLTTGARRDIARLFWVGEPDRDAQPIETLRDAAIPLLERVLADVERARGDGGHLVVHLVPLKIAYERAGRVAQAEEVATRLTALFESDLSELDTTAATGESVPAARWNTICWQAALASLADVALQACDAAVEGARGRERGGHHDSRGVARALTGDFEGAIADFEAFIETRSPISAQVRQRQAWIELLEQGENPFTLDVLGGLAF